MKALFLACFLGTIAIAYAGRAQNGGAPRTNAVAAAPGDVVSTAGSNYAVAAFRFWVPAEVKRVRGVVTLTPGSNGDGRGLIEDTYWQEFARKHGLALVGCFFKDKQHENMNIEEYALASAGSGQALLDAISKFGAAVDHAEMARAPLLLWGHSAGGEFNYEFACWKPERVLAFVLNKGGYYYTHLAPAETRKVPGILFIGEKDEEFRKQSVRGIFAVNRRAGALWTFAVEPGAGHEQGKTREMTVKFFEGVIGGRLSDPGIVAWPAGHGWTGDLNTFEVQNATGAKQVSGLNSWLPDAEVARTWRDFMRGEMR